MESRLLLLVENVHQKLASVDHRALLHVHTVHDTVRRRLDLLLHLHRLQHHKVVADLHLVTNGSHHLRDLARHRRRHTPARRQRGDVAERVAGKLLEEGDGAVGRQERHRGTRRHGAEVRAHAVDRQHNALRRDGDDVDGDGLAAHAHLHDVVAEVRERHVDVDVALHKGEGALERRVDAEERLRAEGAEGERGRVLRQLRRNLPEDAHGELARGQQLAVEQHLLVVLDEVGRHLARGELRVRDRRAEEVDVRRDADDVVLRQRHVHGLKRLGTRLGVHNQLGDHRVVVHEHVVAAAEAGVDAHLGVLDRRHRRLDVLQLARAGQEARVRVFRVDTRLDRVPLDLQVLLAERQLRAAGDLDLQLDEVEARDHLRHRVLHLQTRVHLHEEVLVRLRVEDELDGAGTHVVHRLRRAHGSLAHLTPLLLREARSRRLFEHLLVAPLHGAVALEEVHAVAVLVAEDLHLHVARRLDETLEQHAVVLEERDRLAARTLQLLDEVLRALHDTHALAAAAQHRLDQEGVARLVRRRLERLVRLVLAVVARHTRHVRRLHDQLRLRLRAHRDDRRRRRPDELNVVVLAGLREACVLGQEAVAGVDRLRARLLGDLDDFVRLQVRRRRRRGSQTVCLVGHLNVLALALRVAVDGDGADAHAVRRLRDAARDLTAVRDQDLVDVRGGNRRRTTLPQTADTQHRC
eukprot:Rhum_TRINITY_DN14749_c16_g1::Rhum_TRINITY_DN14749_c16_g1_i1::g.116667::m.116667